MNYIELVNKFWTSHDEHQYTATEIALYFYLLRVFNTCMWKDTIKRNNRRVEVDLGISFYMLKNARNRLMQSGVISFKSQNGNANVSYSLEPTLQMVNEVTNEVTNEVEPRSLTRSLPTKDKPKPKPKHISKEPKSFFLNGNEVAISENYHNALEEMQKDDIWIEPLCKNLRVIDKTLTPDKLKEKIIEFFVLRTNEGNSDTPTTQSMKQHFANWMRQDLRKQDKQLNDEQKLQSKETIGAGIKFIR